MPRETLVYSQHYGPLTRDDLLVKVANSMGPGRYQHVLRVEAVALRLADKYGESLEQASIAALTHDYAKERPAAEMVALIQQKGFDLALLDFGSQIWHGIVGAYLVEQELGITDATILEAIRLHTTGGKEMSQLAKIIYVADYIEPQRNFPGVAAVRELALVSLDQAVALETKQTLLHLIHQDVKIYPKTIETYNQWVVKK